MSSEAGGIVCTTRLLTQDEMDQLAFDDPDGSIVCRENSASMEDVMTKLAAGQSFIEVSHNGVPAQALEVGLPVIGSNKFVV